MQNKRRKMVRNIVALSPEYDVPYEALVVDRPEELNLLSRTVLQKGKIIWIYGRAGTGKTTLLRLFSKRYRDFFKEHKTEIKYINAKDLHKVRQNILESVSKPEYENTLLIIDDSQHLSNRELEEFIGYKKENDNLKLIFSSRKKPHSTDPETISNISVLKIKPPDLFTVLQTRIQSLKDEDTRNRAREIFDKYLHYGIKQSDKSPREILMELGNLIRQLPDAESFIAEKIIDIEEDNSGKIIEIKADFIGIIFALVLFLVAQFSANKSERNISNKIEDVKTTIEYVVTLYTCQNENLYFVNRPVNFRDNPSTKNSTIYKVLQPNTLVSLEKREGNWMYVKCSDYVNNTEQYGWVYGKYLSKILLKN